MTFEERMAELGVDLSDLPTRYEVEHRSAAFDAADNFGGSLSMTHNFTDYILHLTDVIDRMETRLVNLTGERDYLVEQISKVIGDCDICVYSDCNGAEMPCYQCNFPDRNFEFASVPENRRPDDD